RGFVELLGRQVVLRADLFRGARLDRVQQRPDLLLDGLLDGAVVRAPFDVLPQPFLGTLGMRHRFSLSPAWACAFPVTATILPAGPGGKPLSAPAPARPHSRPP